MIDPAFRQVTVEEYLRLERDNSTRHDYIDGFLYAQAEASRAHNVITSNIHVLLHPAAKKAGCQVYRSDMKVRVTPTRYHYPDIVVSCVGGNDDDYTETAPCLIVEVLSESTRMADQNYKAERYRDLSSLQAYLLVDSRSRSAAIWRREGQEWVFEVLGEIFDLPCPAVTLNLADFYDGTQP